MFSGPLEFRELSLNNCRGVSSAPLTLIVATYEKGVDDAVLVRFDLLREAVQLKSLSRCFAVAADIRTRLGSPAASMREAMLTVSPQTS